MNSKSDKFSYSFFENNRYIITDFIKDEIKYSAICNNGYIKLHTEKGRVYWMAQNETDHLTPDWKFHVSVVNEDVKKAWDILSELFVNLNCRSGMKVIYRRENTNCKQGREITIYIYKYHPAYENSDIAGDFHLSYADEHSEDYFLHFFLEIENLMRKNSIRTNGTARGDLALGLYVSLRDECYIFDKLTNSNIYPPDHTGWRAANNNIPFDLKRFINSYNLAFNNNKRKDGYILVYLISFVIILLSIIYIK